jgi:hypothetical protein
MASLPTGASIGAAVTAAATLALSWCFSRPARWNAIAGPAAASVGYALAIAALLGLTEGAGASLVAAAVPLTALALDLGAELRARWRTRLVPVEEFHDVHLADRSLDENGGHLRGVHLRALLRFFGPYVPVWRLAPVAPPASSGGEPPA